MILLTALRHWLVVRCFGRARPQPSAVLHHVSLLQPILSGDPNLPHTLAHNLASASACRRQFIWLVDDDDAEAQRICRELAAAHPPSAVRIVSQPPPPQGVNPKTFKLARGLAAAQGDVICVLDDDTMLPDHALDQCLPYLDLPGAGLAFGLPYQVNFSNLWSALVALFVNASSLPTYAAYAALRDPVTINGMFYLLHRPVLERIDGFAGLETLLADDFAVAQRVRSHGLRLVQTPICHAISTQVGSAGRYLRLMQRWFVFPRESLLRHLRAREQALVYALVMVPTLLPLLLLAGVLIWPSPVPIVLLGLWLLLAYALFQHSNHAWLAKATPWRWSLLVPLLHLLLPLQVLAALILPQRIVWRGHILQVERGGTFRYVRRRAAQADPADDGA